MPPQHVHLFAMGSCSCEPATTLHITPAGVHAPPGVVTTLEVVDEVWADGDPMCSTCGAPIPGTFYRCEPCAAILCRDCVAQDTIVIECDCTVEVTGVQLAARRAAAVAGR